MSIEGFIDFVIFGYLNIKTREFTLNGEISGFSFGVFTLSMSGLVLPLMLIVLILIKKRKRISFPYFKYVANLLFYP
jgi:hypothetical protein